MSRIIDADALRHNWRTARRLSAAANLLAVIKSRGYGHGAFFVADALRNDADGFGVADIADAAMLRAAGIGKPVLLLEGAFSEAETARAAELDLWLAVHNEQQARWAANAAADAGLTVLVKVNAGMNRLGFSPSKGAEVLDVLARASSVKHAGLMAHFARADSPDGLKTPLEILRPLRARAAFVSLGNSAASLLHGELEDGWGRIGIALYGASPAPEWKSREELGLRPAMIFKTELICVRTVRAGEAVGYGGVWRAAADTKIGIAACGYGDGYPRADGLWARAGGQKAAAVGRVSMEMTALDLTGCEDAQVGTEVVLWGESPSICEVAAVSGRISYELLCAAGRG
ncbi:MAG: alanine racemase [Betaproteobacteria bacterium]|nr:alanine racemase [Betaproteobacteria bacterium]